MLQLILEFFLTLGDMANTFLDYFRTVISDSIYVLISVFDMWTQIPLTFSWLPQVFVSALSVAFAVAIIYKFLGRE